MDTPPPRPRPIRRQVFEKKLSIRFGDITFDYALVLDTHEQAEAWINDHPGIEVVQIQTFQTGILAITVVWYRG